MTDHAPEVRAIIVRSWLRYIGDLQRIMDSSAERIERCRNLLDLSAIDYSRDKVSTTAHDSMADGIAALIEAQADLVEIIGEYEGELSQAYAICHRPNYPECEMLWDHYVQRMTWAQVGRKHHYAAKYADEKAAQGIDAIYDALPDRTVRQVWKEMEE